MQRLPRTLIYKRTHTGDPDLGGRFGINGCMGRVRGWDFDAVVGVGGIGPEPMSHAIDGRVTWIGIGAHQSRGRDARGPLVTFDHFLLMDTAGPDFVRLAPCLAERVYAKNIRATMTLVSPAERAEVRRLLRLARNAPPSPSRGIGASPNEALKHRGECSDVCTSIFRPDEDGFVSRLRAPSCSTQRRHNER